MESYYATFRVENLENYFQRIKNRVTNDSKTHGYGGLLDNFCLFENIEYSQKVFDYFDNLGKYPDDFDLFCHNLFKDGLIPCIDPNLIYFSKFYLKLIDGYKWDWEVFFRTLTEFLEKLELVYDKNNLLHQKYISKIKSKVAKYKFNSKSKLKIKYKYWDDEFYHENFLDFLDKIKIKL